MSRYDDTLRLSDACSADTRPSAEEAQLWRAVVEAGLSDSHPEARTTSRRAAGVNGVSSPRCCVQARRQAQGAARRRLSSV